MRTAQILAIPFLFLSLLLLPSPAATQGSAPGNAQIQQLLQSGQVTADQRRQGAEIMKKGLLSPDKLQQLGEKAQQGTLTPADIEAGRKLLKVKENGVKEGEEAKPLVKKVKAAEKDPGGNFISSEQAAFFMRIFGSEFSGLSLFGQNLFSKAPRFVDPIKNTPVSSDYIIGPGDVLNILMWGRMDASYNLEVDSEGVIYFPKIGPLSVAGLTYKETKDIITRKAESITGVNVSISMGRLRTIQIFVLGEVKKPGLHTVSSLATAVNGLLAAGGPSLQGSLRNVQVKRQGKTITNIDLYDILLKGDISKDSRLMPADIIFIPPAETLIAITGNVRKPAVYELKQKERTLRTAIELGGGLAPRAYNQRIQISRAATNQTEVILDIPFADLKRNDQVLLQDGDSLKIFSILPSAANAVYLYGNVLRPGQYAYKAGLSLRDLILGFESLQADTYFDYALIKRYHFENMSSELIPFDLGALLSDHADKYDLPLLAMDEVHIFSKWLFEDKPTAAISGEVRNPGTFEIDKMRIRDLLFKAGGLTKDAFMDMGHLYRTDGETKKTTIQTFNLAKALAEDAGHNIKLQDLDKIVIHSIWEYAGRYTVSATGEVNNPAKYPYAENMTIRDLILLAGNIKESAFLENAELVRFDIVEGKTARTSLITFNVIKVLQEDPSHNIKLQPLDIINIKQIPEWGESRDVRIAGEVLFPGAYSIRKGERLSSIIERAGGYTDSAYFRGAVFARESVRALQQQRVDEMINRLSQEISQIATSEVAGVISEEDSKGHQTLMKAQQSVINQLKAVKANGRVVIKLVPGPAFQESRFNLVMEDKDSIFVPPKPDTVFVAGEVYNAASLIYDDQKAEVKHYLALTGGPTKYANAKGMFILRADGTVTSKPRSQAWLSDFADTPLYPGDTLVVPPKLVHTSLRREIKDISSIIFEMAVTAGILINQVFE